MTEREIRSLFREEFKGLVPIIMLLMQEEVIPLVLSGVREEVKSAKEVPEHFTPYEFGQQLDPPRTAFTVRQWCNWGRINARRLDAMSGPHARWVIDKAELARYKREKLLPPDMNRNR